VKRFLRENSLSIFFGTIFLLALLGQALTGHAEFNNQQLSNGLPEVSLARYVTSSDFATDVTENWQSEYLQFLLYILATVWFLQKGSPESKELDKAGTESDKDQLVGRYARPDSPPWAAADGLRRTVYSWSLGLVMCAIFFASWFAQSLAGQSSYNQQQMAELEDPVAWGDYVVSADFWSRTLQNWQSEFLAVGSMAVFSIYLRQRGSPESKPVGAPHESTGIEG